MTEMGGEENGVLVKRHPSHKTVVLDDGLNTLKNSLAGSNQFTLWNYQLNPSGTWICLPLPTEVQGAIPLSRRNKAPRSEGLQPILFKRCKAVVANLTILL
ncbi:hypothetical protein T265_00754 [Opisthorchis viverrini]|uniref:Uncharacterized protein n=1 Tax=Opisthorchis viverrini TaxID=6198 RepID=A0A075A581_OPIVI|nr:hypothetical protein T265_00754 [Opisthorchis viverrini]KER33452.1 hypothetical protein T265_00754 [Opisthorchis viverrini]